MENIVNGMGNTRGNIINGGDVAVQGDWVYYNSLNRLYKERMDGTQRQQV